jgi:formyl-CoA transferase
MPAVLPRFSRTPGEIRFPGPQLGEHNAHVYGTLLGLSGAELEALAAEGIV